MINKRNETLQNMSNFISPIYSNCIYLNNNYVPTYQLNNRSKALIEAEIDKKVLLCDNLS